MENNKPNQYMIEYYHNMEYMPDRYYHQLNGKSADENYRAQRIRIIEGLTKEDTPSLHITSEVKIKR